MANGLVEEASLDMCYQGQGHALNIPWTGLTQAESAFHQAHEDQFGHRLDAPVELVNVRLGIRSGSPAPDLPLHTAAGPAEPVFSSVYGYPEPVPVLERGRMTPDTTHTGPLIVCDTDATTFIAAGWYCELDAYGNLLLYKSGAPDNQG